MGPSPADAAPATLLHAFHRGVERHPDRVLVRTVDDAVAWTWREVAERAGGCAAGYRAIGVGRGDAVALLLTNRPEVVVADVGALIAGATPVSLYGTSSPEQIAYVLRDAGAAVLVTERQYLPTVLAAREQLPDLRHVVVVVDASEAEAPDGTLTLDALVAGGSPAFDVAAESDAVGPDDLVTLIYTSGTTGPPKGVELSHRNVIAAMTAIGAIARLEPGGRVISWLPAAHIAERNAHLYAPLLFGLEITVCPDPREIAAHLAAVHPDWFFAVPRIWEKLQAGFEAMLAARPDAEQDPVRAALAAATERVRLRQAGAVVPDELEAAVARADAAIFAPLRERLGLDRVTSVNVGAAPTAPSVIEFFHAIGVPVAEIWGLSETCACGTLNPPDAIRIGSVGPPVPGMEVRLAGDGEVLLRGAPVMRGYRNQPDRTREAFDDDGWFRTGDVGRMDDDGYLWIVDRKKELIINTGGKNMSPAFIEAAVKSAHPLIGQVCVIGDARPYNTALIVLDADVGPVWAGRSGLGDAVPVEHLAHEPSVLAEVQRGIDAANATLSRVEQVKRFAVVPSDWLPGGDELTPTMKLKRGPIGTKYADLIEELYAGTGAAGAAAGPATPGATDATPASRTP